VRTCLRLRFVNSAQENGVCNDESDAKVDKNDGVMRLEISAQNDNSTRHLITIKHYKNNANLVYGADVI